MEPKKSSSSNSPKCSCPAKESLCSSCLCCISCPLAVLCCFIGASCKIGRCAEKSARARGCCGPHKNRIYAAAYSSFSDIDSDSLPVSLQSRSNKSSNVRKSRSGDSSDSGTKKNSLTRCWF